MDQKDEISTQDKTKKGCDFFLSYASDDKDFAKHVADKFEERGLDTWFADTDLIVGENIADQIREAINNSRSCVILLSRNSQASKPWVSNEWATIQECSWRRPELVIFVVLLEDVDTPPFLRSCQAFRAKREIKSITKVVDNLIQINQMIDTHQIKGETEIDLKEKIDRYINILQLVNELNEHTQVGGDNECK